MERATIDRDTFVRPNARPTAGVRQDVEDTRAWAATRTLSDGAQTAAGQF
jgi:hypothetical protein